MDVTFSASVWEKDQIAFIYRRLLVVTLQSCSTRMPWLPTNQDVNIEVRVVTLHDEPEHLWAAPDLFLAQILFLTVNECCVVHFVWKQEHITSTRRRLLVEIALSRTHGGTLPVYQLQHRRAQLHNYFLITKVSRAAGWRCKQQINSNSAKLLIYIEVAHSIARNANITALCISEPPYLPLSSSQHSVSKNNGSPHRVRENSCRFSCSRTSPSRWCLHLYPSSLRISYLEKSKPLGVGRNEIRTVFCTYWIP